MTDKLPPQLLALFQPRPGLRYIPPQDSSPETRATTVSKISGIAAFLPALHDYKETDEYHPTESWLERKNRITEEKRQALKEMLSEDFEGFRPEDDPKVKGDALKTLFVGRLGYDVKEGDLEREFSRFGPIERVRMISFWQSNSSVNKLCRYGSLKMRWRRTRKNHTEVTRSWSTSVSAI
jgi:U1 small nuclear ribonucleoprotein 70kDa